MDLSRKMTDLLAEVDIQVNGSRSWDLQVHHDCFFKRVFTQGLLGLGEAYMDGWWDVDKLDQFICKALSSDLRN